MEKNRTYSKEVEGLEMGCRNKVERRGETRRRRIRNMNEEKKEGKEEGVEKEG
jgi:hypothetical protein